jgi:hypothetical protein
MKKKLKVIFTASNVEGQNEDTGDERRIQTVLTNLLQTKLF